MLKVLLITYYWPPAGGGGVQRWLKMSKYFKENEIDLTVYTPENPEYPAYDESSIKEVSQDLRIIKRPILEPYGFYKKFTGKKKKSKVYSGFINENQSWKQKLSVWIRGNFFIPDARKFWIKPSTKFLTKYITDHQFDAVVSTGPPHSMHMIAMGVKKKFPEMKWIADFRDPWTNIDFYDQLMLTKRADRKHRRLEQKVLLESDKVVVVGWTMAKEFQALNQNANIEVITNGYDHKDFEIESKLGEKINIVHLGSLNADRNPIALWKALEDIRNKNEAVFNLLSVELIGQVDVQLSKSISEYNLEHCVTTQSFLPHDQAIKKMLSSHILLLVINNTPNAEGILTGKAFEYLGSKRPILCIGPENGDIKTLLGNFNHCTYISYEDHETCATSIIDYVEKANTVNGKEVLGIEEYSRQKLAGDFSTLIKETLTN